MERFSLCKPNVKICLLNRVISHDAKQKLCKLQLPTYELNLFAAMSNW